MNGMAHNTTLVTLGVGRYRRRVINSYLSANRFRKKYFARLEPVVPPYLSSNTFRFCFFERTCTRSER
jgi:hypothetical protein